MLAAPPTSGAGECGPSGGTAHRRIAPIAAAAVDAHAGGAHAPAAAGADDDDDADEDDEAAAILPVAMHTATGPQMSAQPCSAPAHYSPRPCPPALLSAANYQCSKQVCRYQVPLQPSPPPPQSSSQERRQRLSANCHLACKSRVNTIGAACATELRVSYEAIICVCWVQNPTPADSDLDVAAWARSLPTRPPRRQRHWLRQSQTPAGGLRRRRTHAIIVDQPRCTRMYTYVASLSAVQVCLRHDSQYQTVPVPVLPPTT